MKWLILKIYDHVSHLEECEVVENILGNIIFKITNEIDNNEDNVEHLKSLYYSILGRIEEVKVFNKRYSFDSRVSYFIKIVKLLEKTLLKIRNLNIIEPEVINNLKRNSKLNVKKSVLGLNTDDLKDLITKSNNLNINELNNNNNNNVNEVSNSNNVDIREKEKNQNNQKDISNNINNKKMSLKYDEDIYSKVMNEDLKRKKYSVLNPSSGEKINMNLNLNLNDIQKNNNEELVEEINWKEIVFKVLLNPEEFNLLMQEKEKYTGKFGGSQINSNMTGPNISNISKKLS